MIEENLNRIADALEKIVARLGSAPVILDERPTQAPAAPFPQAGTVPTQATPAPVAAAPATPPAAAPAAAASPSNAPFTDAKGLTEYVMKTYGELGAQKGARIQNVLNDIGYSNINEVKPEDYGRLYAGIEGLKNE